MARFLSAFPQLFVAPQPWEYLCGDIYTGGQSV